MKTLIVKAVAVAVLSFINIQIAAAQKDYTKFVNTFIVTQGTGHTFPGQCMPFIKPPVQKIKF